MAEAVRLGEAARGRTAPNPNVGCVIVKDGNINGRGATQPGGRPHAEAVALRREELFKDSFLFGRQTNAKITHAHAHTSPTIG